MTTTTDDLLALLDGPMAAVAATALDKPDAADALERAYPADGEAARALHAALCTAAEQGLILERGNDALRYSRVAKPGSTAHDLSVDIVSMNAAGPRHRHPRGEANLCWPQEGDPAFDGHGLEGRGARWVVFPPRSVHVPSVSGGRMLIAYFLPGGEMEWASE